MIIVSYTLYRVLNYCLTPYIRFSILETGRNCNALHMFIVLISTG